MGYNGGLNVAGYGILPPAGDSAFPEFLTAIRDVTPGSRVAAKPLKAKWMRVTVVGGGGGSRAAMGGGAGGGCACSGVVPSADVAYTVGAAGAATLDGGDSSAAWGNWNLLATGGKGNNSSNSSISGGVGSGGLFNFTGGNSNASGARAGGAAGPGGNGGDGVTGSPGAYTANNGMPGGGGAGGMFPVSTTRYGPGGGVGAPGGAILNTAGGYQAPAEAGLSLWGRSGGGDASPSTSYNGGELGGGAGYDVSSVQAAGGPGGVVIEYWS